MTRRTERINEQLRAEISDLVMRDLKDPRIGGLVTITEVDVSPDLSHAKVFVSVLGSDDEKKSTMKALGAASHFLQRELRQRLTIRRTPELAFVVDESMAHGQRILTLLDETKAEDA
ncbi:MAG TPA: 30S ribosome-binding factor RbfA [Dehalococcoidia bacterium]|jgi:ribosome-binding factor A